MVSIREILSCKLLIFFCYITVFITNEALTPASRLYSFTNGLTYGCCGTFIVVSFWGVTIPIGGVMLDLLLILTGTFLDCSLLCTFPIASVYSRVHTT
jgi:hypothetical protein